jgi:ATP-binding cassette subfamily F protein uup
LPQEFELAGDRTARENITGGALDLVEAIRRYEAGEGSAAQQADDLHLIETGDGWNLEARIKADATALGVPDLEAPVGPMSGGEKRRVALCRALAAQPDLLLLDEPTNHLDAESILWLETFLRTFAGAVIFVTHDRYFLDRVATRIIELAEGRAYSHPGNYTAYLEAKAVRQQIAGQTERRRQRFLRAELEYVRAGVRAQRSKSRYRLETFYQVAGLEAPPEEREMDLILPPPPPLGNVGIVLKNAGVRVGDRWLFRHLDLTVNPGECTGIVGRNGAGKTTLLRVCLGTLPLDEGTVTIGKKVQINYVDQSREQLDEGRTVLEQVADLGGETVTFGDQKLAVRAFLRRFLFNEERVRERVDRLSGGERARLLLAKVLKRGGNVIVLDEPTNDLDLASLRMLEEALVDFAGSAMVVSHDRYFLDRVCDQVVAFEDGGVFLQPGNYSYYLEKRAERTARESARFAPLPVNVGGAKARTRKLSFKEQRELETMEETILGVEGRVAELETLLNDPAFYITRATEAAGLQQELETGRAEVERLYARWAELEAVGK